MFSGPQVRVHLLVLAGLMVGTGARSQCAADAGADRSAYAGSTTTLGGSQAGSGQPPLIYSWSPSNGLSSTNVPNPTLSVQSQTITYTLTVTDDFGCSASANVTVQVAAAPYLHIRFTNGHETNFMLGNVAKLTYANDALHVFQRSGQLNYWALSIIDHYDYAIPNTVQPHSLQAKVLLSGPYDEDTGLMSDSLRSQGLLPLNEPYPLQDEVHVPSPAIQAPLLLVSGTDAIVDWVLLQARDDLDPSRVLWSRSCLLQRDGDVVTTEGDAVPLPFTGHPVHLAVMHRNHLAAMTAAPITFGPGFQDVDLTVPAIFASGAVEQRNGRALLWPGDVNGDGSVRYTGPGNDRDAVLMSIGGSIPTNTVAGYRAEDANLDGVVRYTGSSNERDRILQVIGGVIPTAIREHQVP